MSVELNKAKLNEVEVLLKDLRLDGPKILTRSLNNTAKKGRTLSSQHIRKQVRLKASYVKERLKIKSANWSNLRASIVADKKGLLLMNYATGTKNGLINVKVGQGRAKPVKGGFLTNVYAKGRKVDVIARRHPRTGKFDVLYGPSVSQVFNTVRDDVYNELNEYLLAEMEKQISANLRGY